MFKCIFFNHLPWAHGKPLRKIIPRSTSDQLAQFLRNRLETASYGPQHAEGILGGTLMALVPSPQWLDSGNNAWQLAAATFVGLQSIPGLTILYGGIVKKKWAINSA